MNKSKIFYLSCILTALLILIVFAVYFFKDYKLKVLIKELTVNTNIVDTNIHHNQVLDVLKYAKRKKAEIPDIIVNFDSHSDMYINIPSENTIADWINSIFRDYDNVDTIYWVIPDEMSEYKFFQEHFSEYKILEYNGAWEELCGNAVNINMKKDYLKNKPLNKFPFVQEFLVNKTNGTLVENIKDTPAYKKFVTNETQFRKVKVYSVTKDSLPDFKHKKVFLSIDADYFSNTGYDTAVHYAFIKSKNEIKRDFYNVFETIKDKNINPVIISLTVSPLYTPKDYFSFLINMLQKVNKYSGIKDNIKIYKNTIEGKRLYLVEKIDFI